MADYTGKTVLVTGAGKGLGEGFARAFAREGAHVIVADIEAATGEKVAREIGGKFEQLDVTQEADWERVFGGLEALDVLVNNAAIFIPKIAFEDMSLAIWRQHFTVNVEGTFLGCRFAINAMKGRGKGAILNIASTSGTASYPGAAAYGTTKAAVLLMTRHAARAGAPYGIRVNALLPGAVMTDQVRQSKEPGQSDEDFIASITPFFPLGRIGQPHEIAEAALYLCSDRASFTTGAMLNVDGGERI